MRASSSPEVDVVYSTSAINQQKNIVICSDGTGQSGGPGRVSNVWRTYLAVDPDPEGKTPQIRFHDDGVGSQDFVVLKVIGGAFGWGISRSLRQLYVSLIQTWNPGDRIYLFGFSRGAYTVRVLAQMICLFGIPERNGLSKTEIERLAQAALDSYKLANDETSKTGVSPTATAFREKYTPTYDAITKSPSVEVEGRSAAWEPDEALIHFIGCWDTVGAVGFPIESVTRTLKHIWRLKFRSQSLNRLVNHARHALAIDDERRTFHPILWDERGSHPNQTIEQVWFPGMHSNVGGGYPKDGLAHLSLLWMLNEAHQKGLQVHESLITDYERAADALGKMYNSRAGLGAYYRYQPRRVEDLCRPLGVPTRIHASTLNRIMAKTGGYAPKAITERQFDVIESKRHKDCGLRPQSAEIERAFDFIWINRGTYTLFLLLTIAFVGLGWWFNRNPPEVDTEAFVYPVRQLMAFAEAPFLSLGQFITPKAIAPIWKGYVNCPGLFALLLIFLGGLLFLTRRLYEVADEVASRAWAPSRAAILGHALAELKPAKLEIRPRWLVRIGNAIKDLSNEILSRLAPFAGRIRTNSRFLSLTKWWQEIGVTALVIAGMMLGTCGLFALGGRWAWFAAHQHEFRYDETTPSIELRVKLATDFSFPTTATYFDTKLRLVEGEQYLINVLATQQWEDKTLPATPIAGVSYDTLPLYMVPLVKPIHALGRRQRSYEGTSVPVFIMIAAIGPDAECCIPIWQGNHSFRAPKSGRLFLFVNDVPGFYSNNQGTAKVTIERLQ